MKIKTSELIGPALDWAVAKCEGHAVVVLTTEEQRQRWFQHVPPHEMDNEVAEFNAYIAASMKPELAVLREDGYKRAPTHAEARMLFNAGPPVFQYSTSWAQGGPIIERESVTLRVNACVAGHWAAFIDFGSSTCNVRARQSGPSPLTAAMRCYVASKLGDEVDVPEELLK